MTDSSAMEATLQGLTHAEAARKLAAQGANELARSNRRSPFRIAFDVMKEPMLALLLVGGVVYLLLGSREEALILLIFACLSIGITVIQEARTERVMDALRDLTSPRALVIREGHRQRIAGREVVVGDLIVLSEGDRVPADALLIEATGLAADESLLTGEAVPVRKRPLASDAAHPTALRAGGEDLPQVFSGSLIVGGAGIAEVTATGPHSELGKIGVSVAALETETPQLQRQIRRLVLALAISGGLVSLAVVVLYGVLRGGWLQAVLAGIAVGMSMLPEEFPMVLAVFMAMGAWRISKARVLTRRASAIETLGAASVLCTDKTGTLTENRMRVAKLWLANGQQVIVDGAPLAEPFLDLAEVGTMASAPQPFDPMEKAFHDLYPLDQGQSLIRSYPLTQDLLAMTQVWQADAALMATAKGAPEAIADLCQLGPVARKAVTGQVNAMAAQGLRVLGLAVAGPVADASALPDAQTGFAFRFLGLVGLADPLRAQVPSAVAECRAAGIKVVMITGDYPATARAIAIQAGLEGDHVISGPELQAMTDEALAKAVKTATIFARIQPEQKLRIVNAFKAGGAVVAMTGDGVNDAPSLKAAHIGVAMGGRGTDVAREAASMVLLDDDFGSIVTTIRLGRRIYDNLRKAMSFILAVHVPIAGLALMPLLLGMPLLFAPVHIAFLEMVIDPVCSLVFEAEGAEPGLMRRPPRPAKEPLFSGSTVLWSLFQGGLVLVTVGAVVWFAPGFGMSEGQTRALGFTSLVLAIVALIFVDRATTSSILKAVLRPNLALAVVLPIVLATLSAALFWPPAQEIFGFSALPFAWLALPPAVAFAVLAGLELLKPIWRHAAGVR
ncbi:MAG: cation-translocating P-type ATPase [Cypionkella sp.]